MLAGVNPLVVEKSLEFGRVFDRLPNVLVQDPARQCAYYIKADQLQAFKATAQTWTQVNDSTVTFVIPGDELVDEVPPFLRVPELSPSVLIRYSAGKAAYFLTFEDLQAFKIPQPQESFDPDSISFIVPRGTEMIEELPTLRRALLQSSTQ